MRDGKPSVAERKNWSVRQGERKRFIGRRKNGFDSDRTERLSRFESNSESADVLHSVEDLSLV